MCVQNRGCVRRLSNLPIVKLKKSSFHRNISLFPIFPAFLIVRVIFRNHFSLISLGTYCRENSSIQLYFSFFRLPVEILTCNGGFLQLPTASYMTLWCGITSSYRPYGASDCRSCMPTLYSRVDCRSVWCRGCIVFKRSGRMLQGLQILNAILSRRVLKFVFIFLFKFGFSLEFSLVLKYS